MEAFADRTSANSKYRHTATTSPDLRAILSELARQLALNEVDGISAVYACLELRHRKQSPLKRLKKASWPADALKEGRWPRGRRGRAGEAWARAASRHTLRDRI